MDAAPDFKEKALMESATDHIIARKPIQAETGLDDLADDVLDYLQEVDEYWASCQRRHLKPTKPRYKALRQAVSDQLAKYLKEQGAIKAKAQEDSSK